MTNTIVTPNLQNCSTANFPIRMRSRLLSAIVKKVRQGDAAGYEKAKGIEYAAKEGHLEALKYIVHHDEASLKCWGGKALIYAAESGHLAVAKYLVDKGISHKIGSALVVAARKGYLDIVEFLLEQTDCTYYEYTDAFTDAFIGAIVNGHLMIVKHFVVRQIVDVPTYEGTLVAAACIQGRLEVAQYLVEEGADVHKEQELALCYAAEGGHFHAVKYLLGQGADIHAQNELALCEALKHGHFLLAIYLLQQGANPYNENVAVFLNAIHRKHPEFRFLCQSFGYLKNEITG
jgi:ankyrin repeat protein